MRHSRVLRAALPAACCIPIALGAVLAEAAMVRVGNLVVRADGGFTPRQLPRRSYAPIRFQGHADIKSIRGGLPPALRHAVLYFDRDGRLSTGGLAKCRPAQLADASPKVARRRCRRAIVGRGHVVAAVSLLGSRAKVRSALTMFNGPRLRGHKTVVMHAQAPDPISETYVVVVPLERVGGAFSYKATVEVPPILGGAGTLTHADIEVGRRYRAKGKRRSYVSARCADGILETRGHFLFADETVISGVVFKPCRAIR